MQRPGPPKDTREPRRRPPHAESSPDRKLSGGTQGDQQPGHDLLTSRFHPGGREVVLAALKQRSHSAPHRREVKVQLLDPGPLGTSSQHAVGVEGRMEAGPFSGFLGDAHAYIKKPLQESILKVVTGPSSVTSDITPSGRASRLQVTHPDSGAGVLSHHQQSSPNAMASSTVAMATAHRDRRLEQTSLLRPSTNHSEETTRRANETLREMPLRPDSPDRHHSQQTRSLSHQGPFQPIQPHHCWTRSLPQFQDTLVQRKPVVLSVLEEAGLVLHRVRRQKKVLRENLDALLRAQTGEILHCQLEALAANRDWREEVRIKKTVDAWINTSTRDIQEQMSSEGSAMTSQQRASGISPRTGRGRPGNVRGSERAAARGRRGQMPGAEPDTATGESYLTRLYGRAPYDGLRRSLKKSPYLRFSSPVSRPSRKPRPRLVESVTGVKVKSRKTQTSPGRPQDCDIIGSCHLTCGDLTESPAVRGSVAMAIPLGPPRTDLSSARLAECRQEVTSPPVASPAYCAVAADDGASESLGGEQLEAPPPLGIIKNKSEEEELKEDVSPGTEFVSVADVVQEELSFVGEEEVRLDGGPSPPLVLYQGPVFPPQTRSVLHTMDQVSVLALDLQRDVLENRMVEWVQQQLMSRMISEMYPPPPSDPALKGLTDRSESTEQSAASDTGAVAGGGGLQLFVDSNLSVDSPLIRQLVSEVLTEQFALLLGHRDSMDPEREPPEPGPGPGSQEEDELVPLIPAPVQTPQLSSREATPPPSEPTSMQNDESPQPITAAAPLEPVATPTSTLEPAPSAGSPPPVHQAPPLLAWENAELPLDEERPEEHLETRSNLLVMSVAEEEPLFFSPVSPCPSPSPLPRGPDPRPESPLPRGPDPRPESPLPRGPDPRPESPLPCGPDPRPESPPPRGPDPGPESPLPRGPDPRPESPPPRGPDPRPESPPPRGPDPRPESPLPRGPDPRPESPPPRGPDPRPESPLPRGPDPRPESPLPRGPDPRPESPLPRGPDPRPESPPPRGPDPGPESPLPRGPDPRPESPPPCGPDPGPESPPRPESSSSSSEESCSTVTAETEAALRHISEGELLLSVHQLAAMAEDAVFSFSSSLQEIQEMDLDPPSEGQVKGYDLWKSKKGTKRRDQWEEVRTEQDSTCSPGQIRVCAVCFEATNQGSVSAGDLMAEPIRTLTSELQTDGSFDNTRSAGTTQVHLPFITQQEEEGEVSVAAETNSSTDIF
ncbi:protein TALPID3 isoform 3-T4 [Spinachia spinachia]